MNVTPDFQAENVIRELPAITQIVRTLKNTTPHTDSLKLILKILIENIAPADAGLIFLWDDDAGVLKPAVTSGYEALSNRYVELQAEKALASKVFGEGRAYQVFDASAAASFAGNSPAIPHRLLTRASGEAQLPESAVAAPIRSDCRKFGVLLLENLSGARVFEPEQFQFVCLAADLIALTGPALSMPNLDAGAPEKPRQGPVPLDILDTLGHELRLPLTAIKGFATALLLEDVEWSPAKRKEFLQLIEEECDRMEILLANCLDSASGDFNQLSLDRQMVSVSEIANQIAAETQTRTPVHQIIVEFPAAFPLLSVDPNWVRQIFRNLLDNAVKYSPDGGLVVVRGSMRQADVLLSISDQGIGISPEDIIPLFERYHRTKISADLGIPGKGLGLPITRMIVEAHGGRIWAHSKLGQGTTMYFTLPLDQPGNSEGKV